MRAFAVAILAVAIAVAHVAAFVPSVALCSGRNAILRNVRYSWSPRDIQSGQNVTLSFSGVMSRAVSAANLSLTVNVDSLPIINTVVDVCREPGVRCPLPAGAIKFDRTVKVPTIPFSGVTISATGNLVTIPGLQQVVCVKINAQL
jgi:hypothetical protein